MREKLFPIGSRRRRRRAVACRSHGAVYSLPLGLIVLLVARQLAEPGHTRSIHIALRLPLVVDAGCAAGEHRWHRMFECERDEPLLRWQCGEVPLDGEEVELAVHATRDEVRQCRILGRLNVVFHDDRCAGVRPNQPCEIERFHSVRVERAVSCCARI